MEEYPNYLCGDDTLYGSIEGVKRWKAIFPPNQTKDWSLTRLVGISGDSYCYSRVKDGNLEFLTYYASFE